jgi:uracil-DNA glycosylase
MNKEILLAGVSDDWLDILDNHLLDEIIQKLNTVENITPNPEDIFNFARETELADCKVIIIGQDPYPKKSQANGLAFSCNHTMPSSLKNIFKCLMHHELIKDFPLNGNLKPWARQGILLLNISLTTEIGKSNEHYYIWESYTKILLKTLIDKISTERHLIIVSWGLFAQKIVHLYKDINNTHFLYWAHPSPLAQINKPFLLCDNFVKINKLLKKYYNMDMNWDITNEYAKTEEKNTEEKNSEVSDNDSKIIETDINLEEKIFLHDKANIDKNPIMKKTDFIIHPMTMLELKKEFLSDDTIVAFTDGSANPNRTCPEAIGAYSAIINYGRLSGISLYGNIENRPNYATNQRAEGMAILKLLEYINLEKNKPHWLNCVIISDSKFWIDMIEKFMPTWENTNIPFESKKNGDLTRDIWRVYKDITYNFQKNISFRHIKGHNKDNAKQAGVNSYRYFCYSGNNFADKLAKWARLNLKVGMHKISIF